jgi:molecular chaperone IbpA
MIYMVIFNDPFYGTLAQEFEKMFTQPTKATYPPYNIVKVNDDKIVMEFAVAGFKKDEISVTTEKNVLSIKADKPETDDKNYLHKGIAARKFTRSFNLPEYFEVESAGHEDGILYIDLVKNVPEEKKPKSIKIK